VKVLIADEDLQFLENQQDPTGSPLLRAAACWAESSVDSPRPRGVASEGQWPAGFDDAHSGNLGCIDERSALSYALQVGFEGAFPCAWWPRQHDCTALSGCVWVFGAIGVKQLPMENKPLSAWFPVCCEPLWILDRGGGSIRAERLAGTRQANDCFYV